MPVNIIITLTVDYNAEVHQSAAALFYKIKNKTQMQPASRVVWFDIRLDGPAEAIIFIYEKIWDFNQGNPDYTNSAVYIIGHGAGGKMAGVPDKQLAINLENFLEREAEIPLRCEFEKLCLLACNVGKLSPAMTGPSYLMTLSNMFSKYHFRKIMAWNSWVTLFTFQHLASLCSHNAGEIQQFYNKLMETYETSKTSVGDLCKFETPPTPFKKDLAKKIQLLLDKIPLEQLLSLIGKRLVEVNSTPKSKQFSSPNVLGLTLPSNTFNLPLIEDYRSRRPITMERLVIPALRKKIIDESVIKLILQYSADWGWVYDPEKSKLCLICPEVAMEVGLPNFG
ncbi:hypothetical protein [Iodobacter fluviatilis]|uniref:Uncharacterized protein n=1 Tax=Iodobacter fluviatilis TaxID=537 RepID=A0A7G3GBL1_9NEIS|nr:hypothetical protein [Iodobacter fluviatilis]QBC44920.1 hypothetical protein C1H71_16185 [Iodobacter fluviatilis]